MFSPKHKRILLSLAMLFLLLQPVIARAQQPLTAPMLSQLVFLDANERPQSVAAYIGRPILLHLWATWCAPCLHEIPALVRIQAAYQPYGLVLLPISQDFNSESVTDFFAENGISNLPVFVDPKSRMVDALGTRGLPISILIDRYGNEVQRFAGNTPWDSPQVRGLLNSLLAPPQP